MHLLTNFAEGNGPYIKTVGLALEVNKELEGRNLEGFKIIVPHVYGDKQRRILVEEFGDNPDILLDPFQGEIYHDIFFKGEHFQQNLEGLLEKHEKVQERLLDYLSGKLRVEDLTGREHQIRSSDITFELSHNPRFIINVPVSVLITEGYISEILGRTISEDKLRDSFEVEVLREVKEKVFEQAEKNRSIYLMSEPSIFSFDENRKNKRGEILTPPYSHLPEKNDETAELGIYVAVTGIEGLQGLFDCVEDFGYKIYSNVDGIGERKHPGFVTNPAIKYQFARAGWSSVWNGMFANVPLITPPYQEGDNPEMYFNEKTIKKLGLGVVYDKNNPAETLRQAEELRLNLSVVNFSIEDKYRTRDGINYMAKVIVDYLTGENLYKYRE